MWKLDDYIAEIARYTDTTDEAIKTGDAYVGDARTIVDLFISAINQAKDIICDERYMPIIDEEITLSSTLTIDFTTLQKTFAGIVNIVDAVDEYELDYIEVSSYKVKCPYSNEGDAARFQYFYIPEDYTIDDLTKESIFPEGLVKPRYICYYAAWFYLTQSTNGKKLDKADRYLAMWNDSLRKIPSNLGGGVEVKERW